ncbi:helix-turn-helix domain-containing protein [bacterium]|nr:helix-turn-helix domain-containing protein [bacterium]
MKTNEDSKKLGDKLKAARDTRKTSLHEVAKSAKISVAYLRKLESGLVNNPSPRILQRLSDVLNVPYLKLMKLIGYIPVDFNAKYSDDNRKSLEDTLDENEKNAVMAFIRYLKEGIQ